MARPISLTPHPDSEQEDLATMIPFDRCKRIVAQHGLEFADLMAEVGHGPGWGTRQGFTLQELRDWLGY